MAQIAIYIDDQLAERLDTAVKESGKSKSKWVPWPLKTPFRINSLTDSLEMAKAGLAKRQQIMAKRNGN